MNRKNLPLLLMLTAGAVTCIITFIQNYSIMGKLIALLLVMLLFLFLGYVMKWTLDSFDRQNEARRKKEEELLEESADEESADRGEDAE